MKHVTVTWDPDRATFVARGTRPEHTITMAAPTEDRSAHGFSPSETLLAAVGGCSAWDVIEILHKRRQPVTGVELRVDGQQLEDAPWPYTQVRVTYVVSGHGVDRSAVERAVQLSSEKYCSVMATIRGVARVETAIELLDEPAHAAGLAPARAAGLGD